MEIIDRLKEAYLDGARYRYLRIRGLAAYSRYMKAKNSGYKMTQYDHSSRLDDRAEQIEERYRNASIIILLAFKAGEKHTRKRTNYQTLESMAIRLWNSRFETVKHNLKLVK